VTVERARVVHHDRVRSEPLAFEAGRVVPAGAGGFRVDLRDHFVFPGLINAHDHLQLNNIPCVAHDRPYENSYDWIDAMDAHRQRADVAAAMAVPSDVRHWHGGLKNLLAGATTVAHHDPAHRVLDDEHFPVALLREFGWSHSLGLGAEPPRYGPAVRASFLATPPNQPWIIHLAEGTDAIAARELSSLDEMGCLASNTVLVHGVGLTSADVACVIEAGAAVVWCPASNIEMLGRTLDPRRLFEAGRLTLGTDSRLTGSRDLLEELRAAAVCCDIAPHQLLRLVTHDASSVLRLNDLGALAFGRRADAVIVRAGADPYATLLKSRRSDLRAVVRGGIPLVADPDFAEWFAHCGVSTTAVMLDGVSKLMASDLARPEAIALEPGLELA
jgi:cytosine/adenosine deaminase-related metal-dependent hydrolase